MGRQRSVARSRDVEEARSTAFCACWSSMPSSRRMRRPKRFRLGLAGIELGRRAQAGMELRRVALPIMEQLSATSGETVLLQVVSPEGDRVVCIERVQQRRGLRLILDVGSTAPLYAGCSSKVLLAYLDKESIDAVLKKRLRPLASHTTTDTAQILPTASVCGTFRIPERPEQESSQCRAVSPHLR